VACRLSQYPGSSLSIELSMPAIAHSAAFALDLPAQALAFGVAAGKSKKQSLI
jgi:hypothetical protein